jgi:hypothetical protein
MQGVAAQQRLQQGRFVDQPMHRHGLRRRFGSAHQRLAERRPDALEKRFEKGDHVSADERRLGMFI